MVDTDDTRRTTNDGRRTTPWVWHKLPTGELIICIYVFNRNKHAKIYLPSTFQTSDIEPLRTKLKLNIHLTKSPKRDHIFRWCLFMLEEHNYLILTS